jgi:hypothetical protein
VAVQEFPRYQRRLNCFLPQKPALKKFRTISRGVAMTDGSVGQVVDATREVELQVKLGNIQARVNCGHSVLAHSSKCELALVGRSINGSGLGRGHQQKTSTNRRGHALVSYQRDISEKF